MKWHLCDTLKVREWPKAALLSVCQGPREGRVRHVIPGGQRDMPQVLGVWRKWTTQMSGTSRDQLMRVLNGEGKLTAEVNKYACEDSLYCSRTEARALS